MTEIHTEDHPLRDKTVRLNEKARDPLREMIVPGAEFRVDNWADRMDERRLPWHQAGNWASKHYLDRLLILAGSTGINPDDEVVYGHIGHYGHLVHASELGEVVG